MKIGFNEATTKECSTLEEDLLLCQQNGFDYIEIRLDKLHQYLEGHREEELVAFFRQNSLKLHAFNAIYTYAEMFGERDDAKRREALLADFELVCRIGKAVGQEANIIVVPPMRQSRYCEPYQGEWKDTKAGCVRILRHLSRIARPYGVKLSFELVGAPKCSVRTVTQAKEIVEETDRENVGYVFDVANLYMYGKMTDYSVMKTVPASRIFAVHINDFDDVPEEEFAQDKRCFCGDGVANVPGFLEVLKDMGYEGMVSIETFRPEHWAQPARQVVQKAYQSTYEMMRKCGCV